MSAEATGWVWRCSPWKATNHTRFLLHLAVADVVNDANDNRFWMSQAGLAEKVGCQRSTVNQWLSEAVEMGALQVIQHNGSSGKPNVYEFVFLDQGGVRGTDRGCPSDGQGGVRGTDTELKRELKGTQQDATKAIAERVLQAWVTATGRDPGRVKMNSKRMAAVKARLGEGYSEQDLVDAVTGITLSAWHMGDNPDRKRYDDLLVAIRDGERVERFRDLLHDDAPSNNSAVAEAMRLRQADGRL